MIFPEESAEWKKLDEQISKEIQELSDEILAKSQERLSKVFYIKDYSTTFETKYPLMCVPNPCTSEAQAVIS